MCITGNAPPDLACVFAGPHDLCGRSAPARPLRPDEPIHAIGQPLDADLGTGWNNEGRLPGRPFRCVGLCDLRVAEYSCCHWCEGWRMKEPDEELRSALNEIGCSFRKDELAYLAITSKSEHPFRDRLAYLLHKRYEADGYAVCREWKHIDLAVLSPNGREVCLVEIKFMYTGDILYPDSGYKFEILTRNDMNKARRVASDATVAVYSLLIAVNPSNTFEERNTVVKYRGKIAKALRKHVTGAQVRAEAVKAVREKFAGRNIVHEGEVPGGAVFGSEVTVLFWLVRDVHHSD